MSELAFVLALALLLGLALVWGGRVLPRAQWQVLATLPRRRDGEAWGGRNLTWYGALAATAYALATALYFLLMAAAAVPLAQSAVLGGMLLVVGLSTSKLVARWVEGVSSGFSVGGAVFVGFLSMPLLLAVYREFVALSISTSTFLAVVAVCYALGEGLGRLACISFGCCYGRPVDELPGWIPRRLSRWSVVFEGPTKKACYASGLEGRPVVPVQAMTATVFCVAGLSALGLLLSSAPAAALIVAMVVTQGWRVLSEFLRADWRGGGRLSAYQWMAAFCAAWAIGLAAWDRGAASTVFVLERGFAGLWQVELVLGLQALWCLVFWFMGLSRVTGAQVHIHLHPSVERWPGGRAHHSPTTSIPRTPNT